MKVGLHELVLYLRLAQAYKIRLELLNRDRALVMAGCCAAILEHDEIAAFCRELILDNNHGHMIRRWKTFREALHDPDFHVFLKQVRRRIPVEVAESTLLQLEYECDVRRQDYDSDREYAAAVMGVDHEWLSENFG